MRWSACTASSSELQPLPAASKQAQYLFDGVLIDESNASSIYHLRGDLNLSDFMAAQTESLTNSTDGASKHTANAKASGMRTNQALRATQGLIPAEESMVDPGVARKKPSRNQRQRVRKS